MDPPKASISSISGPRKHLHRARRRCGIRRSRGGAQQVMVGTGIPGLDAFFRELYAPGHDSRRYDPDASADASARRPAPGASLPRCGLARGRARSSRAGSGTANEAVHAKPMFVCRGRRACPVGQRPSQHSPTISSPQPGCLTGPGARTARSTPREPRACSARSTRSGRR